MGFTFWPQLERDEPEAISIDRLRLRMSRGRIHQPLVGRALILRMPVSAAGIALYQSQGGHGPTQGFQGGVVLGRWYHPRVFLGLDECGSVRHLEEHLVVVPLCVRLACSSV